MRTKNSRRKDMKNKFKDFFIKNNRFVYIWAMNIKWLYAGISLLLCVGAAAQQPSSKACYVDPFIGTDGMGHTFPGACVPFGGVQLSPAPDTSRGLMNIAPDTVTQTLRSSGSATPTSAARDTPTWATSS